MEAVVKFDYTKEQDDEIDLAVGDIVTNVEKVEDGWCQGTLNGKHGLFPENFVELQPKTEPEPPKLRNESDGGGRTRRAKVTFSYTAENEDELSLELSATIDILGEEEEGWWRGRCNGKEGVFPSNFVEPIEEQPEDPPAYTNVTPGKPAEKGRPPSMIAMPGLGGINPIELRQKLKPVAAPIAETKPSQPPQTTSLEKAKVMFPYEADQSDELSVEEGETVDVINKETNQDGWWLIRGKKGKGLVPDNFLSLIQSPKSHTSTSNVAPVNDTRSIVEPSDNPPLPPKTTPVSTVTKPKPPPAFGTPVMPGVELPKLPSKQPDLPPKKDPAELDIPRQDVLDNTKAKDKPKRTARPPSRNISGVEISEEAVSKNDEPSSKAPWQEEISKRKPKPSPPGAPEPTGGAVKPPPVVSSKPAPGNRPKPASKPSKPAVPAPKTPEPPVPTPSPPSKPVAPLSSSKVPPPVAKEEVKPPSSPTLTPTTTTTTTTTTITENKNEWFEAFEQLKKQFDEFRQEICQSMQKDIDILANDLDAERKKTAMMQIDIDRLKKSREFRDNNN